MKTQRVLIVILLIMILATLYFIFSNSLENVAESSAKGKSVMNVVAPGLEIFVGKGNVTDHLVRKIAHFVEFGALGVELMLLGIFRRRVHFQNITNCLFIGLASAVTDESLQMLTDRSPLVKDILLDFSGVVAGVLFVLLLNCIVKFIKK